MVLYNISVILLILFVIVCAIHYKWSFGYWRRKRVLTLPPTFPFGNLRGLLLETTPLFDIFEEAYRKLTRGGAKFAGFYVFTKPIFLVFDLNLINQVLVRDFQYFEDRCFFSDKVNFPLSANLFTLKGSDWKDMRRRLEAMFTSNRVKTMFLETMKNSSSALPDLLNDAHYQGDPMDAIDISCRYALDTIGSSVVGIEVRCLKYPEPSLLEYGKWAFGEKNILMRLKILLTAFSPDKLKFLNIPFLTESMQDSILKFINKKIKSRKNNNINKNDCMQLMIQIRDNVEIGVSDTEIKKPAPKKNEPPIWKRSLSLEEMSSEIILLLFAGYETSYSTISFSLLELSVNSAIQDKLRSEITSVLKKYDGKISHESLSEMTYLDNCIYETLRKYPPLPFLFRECTKNYRIPNHDVTIDKGTIVVVPIKNIHWDPNIHPDPEKYDPDRFNPSSDKYVGRHKCSWLPFGDGPRKCIAASFGLTQIKMALVLMLEKFSYELDEKTKYPIKLDYRSLKMAAIQKMWLRVNKVEEKQENEEDFELTKRSDKVVENINGAEDVNANEQSPVNA